MPVLSLELQTFLEQNSLFFSKSEILMYKWDFFSINIPWKRIKDIERLYINIMVKGKMNIYYFQETFNYDDVDVVILWWMIETHIQFELFEINIFLFWHYQRQL